MSWRAKLRSVHRDVGYLVVGLTVAYGISGVAVVRIDAWNPNRAIYVDDVALGALKVSALPTSHGMPLSD